MAFPTSAREKVSLCSGKIHSHFESRNFPLVSAIQSPLGPRRRMDFLCVLRAFVRVNLFSQRHGGTETGSQCEATDGLMNAIRRLCGAHRMKQGLGYQE